MRQKNLEIRFFHFGLVVLGCDTVLLQWQVFTLLLLFIWHPCKLQFIITDCTFPLGFSNSSVCFYHSIGGAWSCFEIQFHLKLNCLFRKIDDNNKFPFFLGNDLDFDFRCGYILFNFFSNFLVSSFSLRRNMESPTKVCWTPFEDQNLPHACFSFL